MVADRPLSCNMHKKLQETVPFRSLCVTRDLSLCHLSTSGRVYCLFLVANQGRHDGVIDNS